MTICGYIWSPGIHKISLTKSDATSVARVTGFISCIHRRSEKVLEEKEDVAQTGSKWSMYFHIFKILTMKIVIRQS